MDIFKAKPGDKYRRARIALTRNDKAFCERPHLLDMDRIETTDIPTCATDGVRLFVNVEWLEQWSPDEIQGVIMHEVRHRMLKHPLRFRPALDKAKALYPDASVDDLHRILNIAADLRINTDLSDEGWKLPSDGVFDTKREFVGWSMERIFFKLLEQAEKRPMPSWGECQEPSSGKDDEGKGMGQDERRELEQKIDALNEQAERMAKSRGINPGKGIEQVKAAPRSDWKERLATNLSRIRGGDDFSMARMSNSARRMRMIQPGIVGMVIEHVVIGIDTSGSISSKELSLFLSQINALVSAENPLRTTIIQCDSRVQDVMEMDEGATLPSIQAKGRGGTAFQPIFDHILNQAWTPDAIVICTDGDGDRPKDPGFPVFWLTTSGHNSATFGTIIHIQ